MHFLYKFTGNNVTRWIQFSFFLFYQLSLIKDSILTYYSYSFDAYTNRQGIKVFFSILGKNSNIIFEQDIVIQKVVEFEKMVIP